MVLATSQQEFSDADFRVVDNGDQSKKLAFQVSGLTTATTRTWTVPDADVTVTSFAATFLDDTTAAAVRTTLGAVGGFSVQVFTASGTYTPNAKMAEALIECIGGGGGGGGVTGSSSQAYGGGGGGSGSRSIKRVTASDIGASKSVTIGAGGTGSSGATGNAGGDTSVGSLCIGKGGSGGVFGSAASAPIGGAGGATGTGDVTQPGSGGWQGQYATISTVLAFGGVGGSGPYGGNVLGNITGSAGATAGGNAVANSGSGGNGALAYNTTNSAAGGTGGSGIVVIIEFLA